MILGKISIINMFVTHSLGAVTLEPSITLCLSRQGESATMLTQQRKMDKCKGKLLIKI